MSNINRAKLHKRFSKWYEIKELSLCHKLCFSKSYIFGFQCRRPKIFQTMNSVRSNNISLKYQSFTTLDSKDIGIIKSEFVAKTQFLWAGSVEVLAFTRWKQTNRHIPTSKAYIKMYCYFWLPTVPTIFEKKKTL